VEDVQTGVPNAQDPSHPFDTVTLSTAYGICFDVTAKTFTQQGCYFAEDCQVGQICTGDAYLAANDGAYAGRWLRVDHGRGLGQSRKVVHAVRSAPDRVTLQVLPPFDVLPDAGSRVVISQQTFQAAIVDNVVDNACSAPGAPLPLPSSLTNWNSKGVIGLWGPTASSAVEGNQQHYTQGIELTSMYAANDCDPLDVGMQFTTYFVDVRGNTMDHTFGAGPSGRNPSDLFGGGIALNALFLFTNSDCHIVKNPALTKPSEVGFAVSIAHNDLLSMGVRYDQNSPNTWAIGLGAGGNPPEESPLPAFVDTLIYGNTIEAMSPAANGASYGIANGEQGKDGFGRPYYPRDTLVCDNALLSMPPASQLYGDFPPAGLDGSLIPCP
jgi:hypothetical protein